MFISLSGVKLLFLMWSYLNILCINSEKPYYIENTIYTTLCSILAAVSLTSRLHSNK